MLGWEAPKQKGVPEQPRILLSSELDIDEALEHPIVAGVMDRWFDARLHEAPAYSGGVLDGWPAVDVDGFAICRAEEEVIRDFVRYREQHA